MTATYVSVITDALSAITETCSAITGSGNVITGIRPLITENAPAITGAAYVIRFLEHVITDLQVVITNLPFVITDGKKVIASRAFVIAGTRNGFAGMRLLIPRIPTLPENPRLLLASLASACPELPDCLINALFLTTFAQGLTKKERSTKMRNERNTAPGGEANEWDIPVVGIDGFPETEETAAEEAAWRRRMRWVHFWYWPGWTEVTAVGQVLLLAGVFVYSGPLIRWFDPTAGVLDAGALSAWVLSILVVDAFVVSAWLLVRFLRPMLTEFDEWDREKQEAKNGISSCLEAKIIGGSFWGLVLLFVFVFTVLL